MRQTVTCYTSVIFFIASERVDHKLNELIYTIDKARNQLIEIENESDLELDEMRLHTNRARLNGLNVKIEFQTGRHRNRVG